MQAKQILMFESRADLYEWLQNSDLAIDASELKSNDKKKAIIIPPVQSVKSYIDYVNSFHCDTMQTMIWMVPAKKQDEKPQMSIIPVHICSDGLELATDECSDEEKAED